MSNLFLKEGSIGKQVEFVQAKLGLTVNGKYDASVKQAVAAYQAKNGLSQDGAVGAVTLTCLSKVKLVTEFGRAGKVLTISAVGLQNYSISGIYTCRALSGLPAGHPNIKKHNLKAGTDYTQPQHDGVSNAGPIPDGSYSLTLTSGMPFQKTGGGWGIGGWILGQGLGGKIGYQLGISRGGFFLHHDGRGAGTAGCIGVSRDVDMRNLKAIYTQLQKNHPGSTTIKVI